MLIPYPLDDAFAGVELLLRVDATDLAGTALEAIANVTPEAARLHLFRGWFMLRERNMGLATKSFRLALGRDPLEPLAWHGLAAALPAGTEQLSAKERVARLNSAQAVADLRRGKAYLARAALEKLHADYPKHDEWSILLAECLRRLEEVDNARLVLAPHLERVPISAPAALLAAALSRDPLIVHERLREAARSDPAWISARRLWSPDAPPVALTNTPDVLLPRVVVERIAALNDVPGFSFSIEGRKPNPSAQPSTKGAGSAHYGGLQAKGQSTGDRAPQADVEPDLVDVFGQIQRATQRIFGRTPHPLATGDTVALLVTHRGALTRRYGTAVTDEIERRLELLQRALAERGLSSEILIVDQPGVGGLAGLAPVPQHAQGNGVAHAIRDVIRAARRRIEKQNQRIDAVLLVGGDGVIPFHRLQNPSQDADKVVYSDNPYGSDGGSEHVPDYVVARLPDGGADGGELLLALIQRSIDYHEGWLVSHGSDSGLAIPMLRRLVANARAKAPVDGYGASADAWREPSEEIYSELGSRQPLLYYPPDVGDQRIAPADVDWRSGRILYFNLHGLPGGPNWYGQISGAASDEPLPVALTPPDVDELVPGTICVTEACYGAEIMGRSAGDAMALRFLERGSLAFIGCTATAYGAIRLPLGGADVLVQQIFQNLRRGQPIGRAMLLARDWMARITLEQQGYLDPDDAKTLLSFVLLGDPWASPYVKPVTESKIELPAISPIIATRMPVGATTIAPGTIDIARKLIAKLAPQFSRSTFVAAGQGRPDRAPKGAAGTLVFSAATDLATRDGRRGPQIARVTIAHGVAKKVLLSR